MGVVPAEVVMVTANYRFGDLEAAERLGMVSAYIDRDYRVQDRLCHTLTDLVNIWVGK
jgi:FMN phosphatase YigB (HAD superfamily)